MQTEVVILSERPQGNWNSFPFYAKLGEKSFYFDINTPYTREWYDALVEVGKKRLCCEFSFFSSQEAYIFDRIHEVLNTYIPDLSSKVDPLLREFVKNSEKQNMLRLASKWKIISDNEHYLPMDLMGKMLQEKVILKNGLPILYDDPSLQVYITMTVHDNELYIKIKNKGILSDIQKNIITKKIELGKKIAMFDLTQEFEMKTYPQSKKDIEAMLEYEYPAEEREKLWPLAFDEDFEEYWMVSPYFLLIGSKTHTSFFPYYATVHNQLRIAQKSLYNNIPEGHYSAGMGYIQSAFIIESNRSLYGTGGRICTPYQEKDEIVAGFVISFPKIDISFPS